MFELSIIVPTFNEVGNVRPLYDAISNALEGISWEIIYVDDDSTDGTLNVLEELCQEKNNARRIHRLSRRGLSSACVEGFQASVSKYIAVIDGDLQHDETKLPVMLENLKSGKYDMALGSRYVADGGFGAWDQNRIKASQFATKISKLITKQTISDPMSGFFMMTRDAFKKSARKLSLRGYKILLDIVTSFPGTLRIKDVAYEFRVRQHGESKLDSMIMMEFIMMIIEKITRGYIPARFVLFSAVGASGVLVHLSILNLLLNVMGMTFTFSQTAATFSAMTTNFFINNWLTYYDKRLKGIKMITGLFTFYAVCSLGSIANIGVASFVFEQNYTWIISGIAGAMIGTVWNYAATSFLSWRR